MGEKKKGSLTKIALWGGGLMAILFLGWLGLRFLSGVSGLVTNTYSEGYRDAFVAKVTTKGTIAKVWEIETVPIGGAFFVAKDGTGTGTWRANIESELVLSKLSKVRGDQMVRLYYEEKYLRGLNTSTYVISKVEILDDILPLQR